jgi:hypothetical protein
VPTLTFATGFENRIAADCPGTATATTAQLWESIAGTPAVVAGSRPGGRGDWVLEISAAAATAENVTWVQPAATQRVVLSFWFRILNLPTGGDFRIWSTSTTAGGQILLVTTAGVLVAEPAGNAGDRQTGPTLEVGRWYLLEVDSNTSGTQHSMAWRVDGVAQNTATTTDSPGAQDQGNHRFGTTATTHTNAVTAQYDDVVVSFTGADYPLGPHTVVGYLPNSDVDITQVGAGAFVDAGGTAISGGNPAWDNLVTPWDTAATLRVEQTANAAAGYIEVGFADATGTRDPVAVSAIGVFRADSTTACNVEARVNDGGTVDNWTGLFDPSESTNVNRWKMYAVRPNGGTAWTLAALNALTVRFGFSADAAPDPWVVGFMFEAAYVTVPSAPPGLLDPYRRSVLIRS